MPTMMSTDYDGLVQQQSSPSSHHDHEQQASQCSFLFVQTQSLSATCAGFENCQEAAIWCWPDECYISPPDATLCTLNATTHACACSSLPPTIIFDSDESPPLAGLNSEIEDSGQNSTWFENSDDAAATTMTTWRETSGDTLHTGAHSNGFGQPSTSFASADGHQVVENDGLPGGAIAAIVVVSFLVAVALIALSFWSVLKLKRKRKLEGKYCPAVEEQKSSANTLPPLPLPAPEGLI